MTTVTKAQLEILYAAGRAACCRDYAGYEPHPVLVTLDEIIRCDQT